MSRRSARARRNETVHGQGGSLETMLVIVAVAAALYLGRAIAIPIAIAVLISFLLGPAVTWLRRRRVGRIPAVFIAVAPAICALVAFAYLVVAEVGRLADNIPAYQANIEGKIAKAEEALPTPALLQRGSTFLKGLRNGGSTPVEQTLTAPRPAPARQSHNHGNGHTQPDDPAVQPAAAADAKPIPVQIENPEPSALDLVRTVLGPLVDPVSDVGLILLFVVFFLAERETLRDRIIRLAGPRDLHRTTMAMDEAGNRLSRYLLLQTVVNALYGVVIAIALTILGLPNAALWGAIAALLRFIPYVGVAAAAILPIALAFAVDPGWSMMFWTAGVFLALELVVGNVLEPWLYGASTGLSAVALVVSAIFWTWLWGTIGLLLATPLTVCIAVVGRHVPQLAFLDVLLGNQAPLKPEESFYQRLLAGNVTEAASQGEDWLKANTMSEFLDQVALPALILAEHDRSRGELEEEHVKQVADGVRTVVAILSAEIAKSARAHPRSEDAATTPRSAGVVLCVAGQSELDEAAAVLLTAALEATGRRAITIPSEPAVRLSLPDFALAPLEAVCLSFLSADALPHARYLARRFRRRVGTEIPLVVAFWGVEQNAARLLQARAETRADRVVASIPAAVAAIHGGAHADRAAGGIEPELNALAVRISEVIGPHAEPATGGGRV